jgi:hypothetical protein
MRNIDVKFRSKGLNYLFKNESKRTDYAIKHPLYSLYYKKRNNELGCVIVSIPTLSKFITNYCYTTDKDYLENWLNSINTDTPIIGNTNIRWRLL